MTNSFFDGIRRALFGPTEADPFDTSGEVGDAFPADKGWTTIDPPDVEPLKLEGHEPGFGMLIDLDPADPKGDVPARDPDMLAAMEALAHFLHGTPSAPEPGEDDPRLADRRMFDEDDVNNFAHDLAQVFLQSMIDRETWAAFDVHSEDVPDDMPTPADNYRRVARFVFSNVLGFTSDRDGEHTNDDDCKACAAVYGEPGGWARPPRAQLNVAPTSVVKIGGDDLEGWDGAFGGEVYGGPPGSPAPGTDGYEGNWRLLGHVTEHGFVEVDGVNLTPESRARIEAGLFDKLGRKPKPFDDDFDRLLGTD